MSVNLPPSKVTPTPPRPGKPPDVMQRGGIILSGLAWLVVIALVCLVVVPLASSALSALRG